MNSQSQNKASHKEKKITEETGQIEGKNKVMEINVNMLVIKLM